MTSMLASRRLWLVTILAGLLAGQSSARAADAPGCIDPASFKRFEGSHIVLCTKKDFAEYTLATGKLKSWDYNAKKPDLEAKEEVEGKLAQNLYLVQPGPSSAEVFRNYKLDLEARGFQVLYTAKGLELGADQGRIFESNGPGGQLVGYSPENSRYLAAVKDEDGQRTFVSLYVIEFAGGFQGKITPQKNQVLVRLDVIIAGELKDRLVVVPSAEIKQAIKSKGRITIYGILFDFNKADIKPQSRPVIEQIAKFLIENPGQRLNIVGHTDDVGGPEFNDGLSRRRAAEVVQSLIRDYAIAPERLQSSGAGLRQPIATNASDEGRSRNRRVELIPL